MKTTIGLVALLSACGVATNVWAERLTREQVNAEVQKCTDMLSKQTNASGDEYKQCMDALMARTTSKPPASPAPRQPSADGIKSAELYHCRIPALGNSRLSSQITIWKGVDKNRYFASPSSDERQAYPVKGFGTPGKGNMSFTFNDGASITIAQNGWTTTSLDKVHNKNSLYGPVSSAKNTEAGQCDQVSASSAAVRNIQSK